MMIQPMTFAARTRFYQGLPESELPVAKIHDELAAKAARRPDRATGSRMTPAEDPVTRAMRMFRQGNPAEGLAAIRGHRVSSHQHGRLLSTAAEQGLTQAVRILGEQPATTPKMLAEAERAYDRALMHAGDYSDEYVTTRDKALWNRLMYGTKARPNRTDMGQTLPRQPRGNADRVSVKAVLRRLQAGKN